MRHKDGIPPIAHASSVRSRSRSERCRAGGLRTFLYASLMPTQNPIDLWSKVAVAQKQKAVTTALGRTPRESPEANA